jgi:hypothetical protein
MLTVLGYVNCTCSWINTEIPGLEAFSRNGCIHRIIRQLITGTADWPPFRKYIDFVMCVVKFKKNICKLFLLKFNNQTRSINVSSSYKLYSTCLYTIWGQLNNRTQRHAVDLIQCKQTAWYEHTDYRGSVNFPLWHGCQL